MHIQILFACFLQWDCLPQPLVVKVLGFLDTQSRARAASVSKEWQELIKESWSSIDLSLGIGVKQDAQRDWLELIASKHSHAICTLELKQKFGTIFPTRVSLAFTCDAYRSIDLKSMPDWCKTLIFTCRRYSSQKNVYLLCLGMEELQSQARIGRNQNLGNQGFAQSRREMQNAELREILQFHFH